MFIDVVNAGWVPIYNTNLSEDVIGYIGAPAIALSYAWTHLIGGHLGRLATREDVAVHQAYASPTSKPTRKRRWPAPTRCPCMWRPERTPRPGVKAHLDAVTERAAAPV